MFTSVVAVLALAASVSQVTASPINHVARDYAKDAAILEDYTGYHVRYIALGCTGKQGSDFFEQCCHPLLRWQKLSDRPAQCIPSATASSSAALVEPSAPAVDADPVPDTDVCDDDEDDDECTDDSTTSSYPPASTTIVKTSVSAAKPTSKAKAAATSYAPQTTKEATSDAPQTTEEASYSAPAPTTTHKPTTTKESTTAAPTSSAAPSTGSGPTFTGGKATFFTQNGVAGACGDVHKDSDFIVAADYRRYGALDKKSDLCGKKVFITNTDNGKSITATIADACPTCDNQNCLDLSKGAFDALGSEDTGVLPITWSIV